VEDLVDIVEKGRIFVRKIARQHRNSGEITGKSLGGIKVLGKKRFGLSHYLLLLESATGREGESGAQEKLQVWSFHFFLRLILLV
tara:strand:+ start:40 stop:294 length:255 start_codon:yes stop_codon:yes gene_type:complete